jgi:hypothetical protein
MPSFTSRKVPWTNLPAWVEDLELPAKRIERDYVAVLSAMSLGIALVSFRRRATWRFVGLPRPGVAASAAAAFVLVAREAWIQGLVWYGLGTFLGGPQVSHIRGPLPDRFGVVGVSLPRFSRSATSWVGVSLPRFLRSATSWYTEELFESRIEVPAAILGIWGYVVLARGWKARDDWRDWLGRWLGWCWVSVVLFDVLAIVIWG